MNQPYRRISERNISLFLATGLMVVAAINVFSVSVAFPASVSTEPTIIEEWSTVQVPPPPELKAITVDARVTAVLILDIQYGNCNPERRPRGMASLPKIQSLLAVARDKKIPVIYSLTRSASKADIRKEVAPLPTEPIVKSGVDKFFRTDLETILKAKGIETVILVGTSAHGAVLHTATGAAQRGLRVIVPVDGMSASDVYAEQYTCWHPAPHHQCRTALYSLIRRHLRRPPSVPLFPTRDNL